MKREPKKTVKIKRFRYSLDWFTVDDVECEVGNGFSYEMQFRLGAWYLMGKYYDYHGKHIAYFMRQALAWLEGHSCSDDSQDKSDNSPLPRYQVIELTILVKQLVSQLKKAKPDCKLPERAMDYLLRNGLVSVEGVLR